MKFVITSVTGGGGENRTISTFRGFYERYFQAALLEKEFSSSIKEAVIVIVAVDSSDEENRRFYKKQNTIGKYKDFSTGGMVNYISLALLVNPDVASSVSQESFNAMIFDLLKSKLESPDLNVPKTFNYVEFSNSLSQVIELAEKIQWVD